MKIKILRNTAIKGEHIEAGKVAEVSDGDGLLLIRMKKAERYEEPLSESSEEKPATKAVKMVKAAK